MFENTSTSAYVFGSLFLSCVFSINLIDCEKELRERPCGDNTSDRSRPVVRLFSPMVMRLALSTATMSPRDKAYAQCVVFSSVHRNGSDTCRCKI